MKYFIGVKIIKAKPMTLGDYNKHRGWNIPENEDPNTSGFLVEYPDGYQSWSPDTVFKDAYLEIGEDPSKITQEMVDNFIGKVETSMPDNKTTMVKAETITGFVQYETSSCVDPENFDMEIGKEICLEKVKNTIWQGLGFVLQWGRFGLKKE